MASNEDEPKGRYELKFPCSMKLKAKFFEAARVHLQVDPHTKNSTYRVSSLYYDTPDLRACWEKLDGKKIRRKYRLRYYSTQGGDLLAPNSSFMEIKHRVANRVYKERLMLSSEGVVGLLQKKLRLNQLDQAIEAGEETKRSPLDCIRKADFSGSGLKPINVITYLREAWQGELDQRLRVTFDTQCRVYYPKEFAEVEQESGNLLLPEDMCIMEIKFDHAIPTWIRELVRKHGLQLQRFSKYATGVESHHPTF